MGTYETNFEGLSKHNTEVCKPPCLPCIEVCYWKDWPHNTHLTDWTPERVLVGPYGIPLFHEHHVVCGRNNIYVKQLHLGLVKRVVLYYHAEISFPAWYFVGWPWRCLAGPLQEWPVKSPWLAFSFIISIHHFTISAFVFIFIKHFCYLSVGLKVSRKHLWQQRSSWWSRKWDLSVSVKSIFLIVGHC